MFELKLTEQLVEERLLRLCTKLGIAARRGASVVATVDAITGRVDELIADAASGNNALLAEPGGPALLAETGGRGGGRPGDDDYSDCAHD
jgi:hypothetical protein